MSEAFKEQKRFVRDIRGAPASILIILLISGRCLTKKKLATATGYSDKPIQDGCDLLQSYGLVQFHGHYNGWSINKQLPLPFLKRLWEGHSGVILADETETAQTGQIQETARSSQVTAVGSQDTRPSGLSATEIGIFPISSRDTSAEDRKNSDLQVPRSEFFRSSPHTHTHAHVDHDHDCLIDHNLDIDSSINQSDHVSEDRNYSDLEALMTRMNIHGRWFEELRRRQYDPDHLLAWHWYSLTQTWLENPVGYVVRLIKDGKGPPAQWLALVRWWGDLPDTDRRLVIAHARGNDRGVVLHGQPRDGRALAYWLEESEVRLPETAVLDTLLYLVNYAPEELGS